MKGPELTRRYESVEFDVLHAGSERSPIQETGAIYGGSTKLTSPDMSLSFIVVDGRMIRPEWIEDSPGFVGVKQFLVTPTHSAPKSLHVLEYRVNIHKAEAYSIADRITDCVEDDSWTTELFDLVSIYREVEAKTPPRFSGQRSFTFQQLMPEHDEDGKVPASTLDFVDTIRERMGLIDT